MAKVSIRKERQRQYALLEACSDRTWANVLRLKTPGTNLYLTDAAGNNPLHYACMKNNIEVAKNILKQSKNNGLLHNETRKGDSPLVMAIRKGDTDMAKLFLDHGAPLSKSFTAEGLYPLHVACMYGRASIVSHILSTRPDADIEIKDDRLQETPLHTAICHGRVDVVRILLENNASVNCQDKCGSIPLRKAIERPNPAILELILARSPNIDAVGRGDITILHDACYRHDKEAVRVLTAHGANPNTHNSAGYTPLHTACQGREINIVRMLLVAGANVDGLGNYKCTPLGIACMLEESDIVQLLLQHNAGVRVPGKIDPVSIAQRKRNKDIWNMLTVHLSRFNASRGADTNAEQS